MKKFFTVLTFLLLSSSTYAESIVLSEDQLRETINDGVKWMKTAQELSGHFRYEYMPFWDRYVDDDNIVRQAGALYVLGEIATRDSEKKLNFEENMKKALGYLQDNSVEDSFNGYDFSCVLIKENVCNLGGTALALVGALDLVEAYPELNDKHGDLIEGYKNFIVAMKIPEAGFRDSFYLEKAQTDEESTFSNGEAQLALVRYYLHSPSEELQKTIEESTNYFIKTYRSEWDPNYYLWGMAALKDWYKLFPKDKYYNFVKNYTDWRIAGQKNSRGSSHNRCAYIEGVVSAYSVLSTDLSDEEKEKYLEEINAWLTIGKKFQLKKSDIVKIIFNKEGSKILKVKKPLKAVGGFLTDLNEPFQRIDFTQHCVSSYLQKLVDIDGGRL